MKHAYPVISVQTPASEWQLSPRGRESCIRLADWLRAYRPFRVYTSQEPKAAETGQITASLLQIPCEAKPGLHEHERPRPGLAPPAVFQASVQSMFERPHEVVFGSESADQAHERFAKAVNSLLAEWAGQAGGLVIVAHGTVISLFTAQRCGLEAFPLWQSLGLPSAVVIDLMVDGHHAPTIENNF